MKYLVSLVIVGLHLPQLSLAFTSSFRTIHDPSNPLTICRAWKVGGENLERSSSLKNSANVVASTIMVGMLFMPTVACAVSGGGLDYANLDITGQDFSNGNYKGKDFTQVIAKATNFAGSNLQGCRFYKAYLVRADFTGADLRGASLEDTSMDEASLRNAIAGGAYFSNSVMDAKDLENADFTDAQFPSKTQTLLCQREDVKGTNPTTGTDTRESLMCP